MPKNSLLIALGVTAIAFSAQALALTIPIGNVTLATGAALTNAASDHIVWKLDVAGTLKNIGPQPLPYEGFLARDASAPGSNIELSTLDTTADFTAWTGGTPPPPTTLSGDFAGSNAIMLASPTFADWTAGGNALAEQYITAALASIGKNPGDLTGGWTLASAAAAFVSDINGAFKVSDPNVAYVNWVDGLIEIGLQGLYDASELIDPLLALVGLTPNDVPTPQASEVVKYSYGGQTGFLYSFSATETGQAAEGCTNLDPLTCSYTGNYEVTLRVPAPATLALLSLGLAGIGFGRRFSTR